MTPVTLEENLPIRSTQRPMGNLPIRSTQRPMGKRKPYNRFRNEAESSTSEALRILEARLKLVNGPAIDEKLSLPFNMECKKCTSVIAAGVKLNDEREKVMTLFGKVWRFNVKCPYCGFGIVIETISVRPGYIIVEGAEEHPKRERPQALEEMLKLMSYPGRIRERRRGPKKPRLL